jgi:hypothetical protein
MSNKSRFLGLAGAGLLAGAFISQFPLSAENVQKEDRAIIRTRTQVRMLDDLYKTAVVLITKHYVNSDTDLPAGSAAKALFKEMKQKGWHEVRLVDASGDPLVEANSPADDFEKTAVKAILDGNKTHEEVVSKEGKRYLRMATPVPVVMKKCTMCHPNYEKVPEGRAIGVLAYTMPVVE